MIKKTTKLRLTIIHIDTKTWVQQMLNMWLLCCIDLEMKGSKMKSDIEETNLRMSINRGPFILISQSFFSILSKLLIVVNSVLKYMLCDSVCIQSHQAVQCVS